MIVVTTENVEGKKTAEVLGLVRGNAVRAAASDTTSWRASRTSPEVRCRSIRVFCGHTGRRDSEHDWRSYGDGRRCNREHALQHLVGRSGLR